MKTFPNVPKMLGVAAMSACMFLLHTGIYAQTSDGEFEQKLQSARKTSSALSAAQREKARQYFSSAYNLLQSEDTNAALAGFRSGLDIDPANALGNFYYAEILMKLRREKEALGHYQIAMTLAPSSSEGLKAKIAAEAILQRERAAERDAHEKAVAAQNAIDEQRRFVQPLVGKWRFRYGNMEYMDTWQAEYRGFLNIESDGTGRFDMVKITAKKNQFGIGPRDYFSTPRQGSLQVKKSSPEDSYAYAVELRDGPTFRFAVRDSNQQSATKLSCPGKWTCFAERVE